MSRRHDTAGKARFAPVMLAVAVLGLAIPAAGAFGAVAIGDTATSEAQSADQGEALGFMPFTPARLDPRLIRKVASSIGVDALRFTPAARPARKDRTLTVAVRVDDATVRAISVRKPLERASADAGLGNGSGIGTPLAVEPTRYNLGIARGYQGFAQPAPKSVVLPAGVRDIAMADLSAYAVEEGGNDKPDRFQPRVALDAGQAAGRAPRTLESLGGQSVDVGGAYRVTRNLDVTAGVRLSQERNRLTPLTDGVEDSQAVYVGTQLRF